MPLDKMISEGNFREDLLYRINTIHVHLPALRERLEDLPVLADHFLRSIKEKYRKPKVVFKKSALNQLTRHGWPGNIRELQHTLEKAVIMTSDNFIKPEDLFFQTSDEPETDAAATFNLAANERALIERALKKFSWNMSKTAAELGINRSTLYEKIKKYEL
jgi:DNA-binding NtrC family response regulator